MYSFLSKIGDDGQGPSVCAEGKDISTFKFYNHIANILLVKRVSIVLETYPKSVIILTKCERFAGKINNSGPSLKD